MSYSTSPHLLPEKLRDKLDQHVLQWVDICSPKDTHIESILLREVVTEAKAILHREHRGDILRYISFDIAKQLCEEEPELRDVLRAALKEKKFGHIVDQGESFH